MKRTFILFIAIMASALAMHAQEPPQYAEAVALLNEHKTDSLKVFLERWEAEEPQNAEIYALWLNCYYLAAAEEVIELTTDAPQDGEAFALVDSTGNEAGYMTGRVRYDKDILALGYEKIDRGISLHPDRLDLYFGKAHLLLNASEDHDGFLSVMQSAFARHKVNGGAWMWTFNEMMGDDGETFIYSIQDYFGALYSSGALEHASRLVEMALETFPDNIMFLSDKAALAFSAGDLQTALDQYLKILEIDPKDYLVMTNVAYIYAQMNKTDDAVKYYTMVKSSGDPDFAPFAAQALEDLGKGEE